MNTFTRSREPSYYHRMMMRILIISAVLWALWEPIKPIRTVTADALSTVADLVSR